MIRIFKLVLLLVVSQVAFGQAPSNYTNINGRYRWIAGMFDSTFHIPKGTTPSLRTGGSTNSGGLFYNTSDSSVYTYTGTQWIKLRGSLNPSDTTNKYITQVYKKSGSDSVFYVKGGTHTWAFNDSTGAPGGGGGGKIYYFNGGVNMGTFGGFTMYELGDTANTGSAANFTRATTGAIANFITDPNKPGLLQIPAGVWTIDAWLSESGGGASHAEIWAVLEKWNGSTITTIATSPIEEITEGNTPNLYTWAITVPTTSLAVTDRIIIQFYITNTNGKTVTLYTQNGYVGEVHTTFTTGIGALNGLTAASQYLTTGTSGTDFNISSVTATHTFNLPTASATNRGALSSADWTTFNNKLNISDTASMLSPYLRKVDTASLSNRINLKLNISDTATMLNNYVNNVGYGLSKVGKVVSADSATLASYFLRRKDSLTSTNLLGYVTRKILADSTAAVRAASGTGTVTSVGSNTGTGLTGGPITTSGTLAIDTITISTRKWRQKGIDSVQSNLTSGLALKVNISDTASMLSPYLRSNVAAATYVPQTRTITINGTSQDLSANRTFSVGTVTSVGITAGTGISVANSPVTGSGNITVTNTAPDQTVALTAGTGITIGGTYPSFTITNSSPSSGGTVTSVATNNGTGITGGTITGAGTLAIDTVVISTRAWRQKGIDSVQGNLTAGLALKLNISDTANMLLPYLRKVDTASLSNRINTKLNISDTATMLGNYVNNVGYGLSKVSQVVSADSATLASYFLRRKDSLTATNLLGYVTGKILADTAAAVRAAAGGGSIGGSGTTNRIAKFTASGTIGNSSIADSSSSVAMTISSGGSIGVGTSAPDASYMATISSNTDYKGLLITGNSHQLLQVQSTAAAKQAILSLKNGGQQYSLTLDTDNAFKIYDNTATTNRVILNTTGNLGLSTATIGSRLQVNGNAAIGYSASTAAPTNGLAVAGNVGVGTTAPTSYTGYNTLAINGTTAGVLDIMNNGTVRGQISGGTGNFYVEAKGASAVLDFLTNLTVRASINASGLFTIGNGETASSPSTGIISGTGGTGTNVAGAEFRIRGGASTGSGAGGPITFYTSAAGSAGTSTNAATEVGRFTSSGLSVQGRAAIKPGSSTIFADRLFEISGTAGTTGATQYAFVQNPTFGTPTTIYSWYNSIVVTSATTSYGLYYDTEGGTITNKWGLYFVGGTNNYLAGNLGLGTTTIGSKLQVNGNAAIGYSASTAAPTNGLAVSGNVGIGTTSTNAPLTILGSAAAIETTIGTSNASTYARFVNTANTNTAYFGLDGTGLAGIENGAAIMASSANRSIIFAPALSERMRITSGGQVTLSTGSNVSAIAQTGYSLTGSNAQSLLDLAGTWNTTGNPTAIKLNITNTASGASADLMELQVGGTNQFRVTKGGAIETDNPTGGTKKPWKLGSVMASSMAYDATRYIEVEVDGTLYYLALSTLAEPAPSPEDRQTSGPNYSVQKDRSIIKPETDKIKSLEKEIADLKQLIKSIQK